MQACAHISTLTRVSPWRLPRGLRPVALGVGASAGPQGPSEGMLRSRLPASEAFAFKKDPALKLSGLSLIWSGTGVAVTGRR